MEFGKSSANNRSRTLPSNVHYNSLEEEKLLKELIVKYPFAIQLFDKPPTGDILLENFVDFAMERLKVLRIIENLRLKNHSTKPTFYNALAAELLKENLTIYLKKTQPKNSYATFADYYDRLKDHISHYVLRLTYCKTEELRNWFIKQEVELFEFRFDAESRENIRDFLKINGMLVQPISEEERDRVIDNIRLAHSSPNRLLTDSTEFYRVPFIEILDLVEKRKVYLENGYGFISIKGMASVISTYFRQHLTQCLKITAEWLPNIEDEETRLTPWIDNFYMRYLGKDYAECTNKGCVTAANVDNLSEDAFPLCMQSLHEVFRRDHHVRHHGRLQYSLFLKGIGMTLEEILIMWKEEFTKVMDGDKFDKQYAYNLRHSYGKEGKRANYTPYSCMKVINGLPAIGPADHHGCPFKNLDIKLLKQKLNKCKISESGTREIVDLASKGHYQLGCTRYFELKRNITMPQPFNHPVEYFEKALQNVQESCKGVNTAGDKSIANQSKHKITKVYAHQLSQSQSSSQSQQSSMAETNTSINFEDDHDMDAIMGTMEY
ncbi:DNA primase large subunit [Chamberlinius hualienensis]